MNFLSLICLLSCGIVKIILALVLIAIIIPDGFLKDILCFIIAIIIMFSLIIGGIIFVANLLQ